MSNERGVCLRASGSAAVVGRDSASPFASRRTGRWWRRRRIHLHLFATNRRLKRASHRAVDSFVNRTRLGTHHKVVNNNNSYKRRNKNGGNRPPLRPAHCGLFLRSSCHAWWLWTCSGRIATKQVRQIVVSVRGVLRDGKAADLFMGHRLLASGRGFLTAHVDAYTVDVLNRRIRDITVRTRCYDSW